MSLSKNTKAKILFSLLAGLFFAGGMYLLDVYNNKPFNLNTFIFNFLIFSTLLGAKEIYLFYKRKKNNNNKEK